MELNTIKTALCDKEHQINILQNDTNDQIDRNIQSTILVRGLPQKQNEKSWNDTVFGFANNFVEKLDWYGNSRNLLLNNIERIHQWKKKEDNDNVPLVYIKILLVENSSVDSKIVKDIRMATRKKKTISVQQKTLKQSSKIWILQTESTKASRIAQKRKSGWNM